MSDVEHKSKNTKFITDLRSRRTFGTKEESQTVKSTGRDG